MPLHQPEMHEIRKGNADVTQQVDVEHARGSLTHRHHHRKTNFCGLGYAEAMTVLTQLNSARAIHLAELPSVEIPGLYVHIPFCFHKCHYCDFYSITRQDPQ